MPASILTTSFGSSGFSALLANNPHLAPENHQQPDSQTFHSPNIFLRQPLVTSIPQIRSEVRVSQRVQEAMVRVQKKIMQAHEQSHPENPSYTALNHLKWWIDLVRRDFAHVGPVALADAGAMLFARFQESEEERLQAELILMSEFTHHHLSREMSFEQRLALREHLYAQFDVLSQKAGMFIDFSVEQKTSEFWEAIWPSLLLSGSVEQAAYVIQKVSAIDPDLAEYWLRDLETQGEEWENYAFEIRDLADADSIQICEDVPNGFMPTLEAYQSCLSCENWDQANQLLKQLYSQLLVTKDWNIILAGIQKLTQVSREVAAESKTQPRIDWEVSYFKDEKIGKVEDILKKIEKDLNQKERLKEAFSDEVSREEWRISLRTLLENLLCQIFGKTNVQEVKDELMIPGVEVNEDHVQKLELAFNILALFYNFHETDLALDDFGGIFMQHLVQLDKTSLSQKLFSSLNLIQGHTLDLATHSQDRVGVGQDYGLKGPLLTFYSLENDLRVHEDLAAHTINVFLEVLSDPRGFADKMMKLAKDVHQSSDDLLQQRTNLLSILNGLNEISHLYANAIQNKDVLEKRSKTMIFPSTEEFPLRNDSFQKKLFPFNFHNLPTVDRRFIPEEHRDLIPSSEGKVLFPRFYQMIEEASSLIMLDEHVPIRYFGPPGIGKTTIPEVIAAKQGLPLLRVPNSRRTDISDYEGHWSIQMVKESDLTAEQREMYESAKQVSGFVGMKEEDGILLPVFEAGPVVVAAEYGYHLVLDEFNQARNAIRVFMNNYFQPGKKIVVMDKFGKARKIKVHERYQVWVTENGNEEEGRLEHDRAFLRRFASFYMVPWSEEEVAQVIREVYTKSDGTPYWDELTVQTIAKLHTVLYRMSQGLDYKDPQTGQIHSYPKLGSHIHQEVIFSPRSFLRFCERLIDLGDLNAENLSRAFRAEYILPLGESDDLAESRTSDRSFVWDTANIIFKPLLEAKGLPPNCLGEIAIQKITPEKISQDFFSGQTLSLPEDFVWTDVALNLIYETLWNYRLGYDVIVVGDTSEGKTYLGGVIADLLKLPLWSMTASPDMDKSSLVGRLTMNPDRTVGFQPGPLSLAVENGGIFILDEAYTGKTTLLEEVFNPLTDGDRALRRTAPYGRIQRQRNTHLYFATNDNWSGDFRGRNQFSRALSSRFATIVLTGEGWRQTDQDKVKILDKRNNFVQSLGAGSFEQDQRGRDAQQIFYDMMKSLGPQESKKKSQIDSELRALSQGALYSMPVVNDASVAEKQELTIPIHTDWREKFKLPDQLILSLENDKITIYEIDAVTSEKRELSETTQRRLARMQDFIKRRLQTDMMNLTGTVYQVDFYSGEMNVTDLKTNRIYLSVFDMLRFSLPASLGTGMHEYGHAILDEYHSFYLGSDPARLYFNVIADPKVNEFASSLSHESRERIEKFAEALGWTQGRTEEEKEEFRSYLPHVQFAYAIIHYWRFKEIMPWVVDEKVHSALEEALPILEKAFTMYPKHLGQYELQKSREDFFAILDEAWPIYLRMLEESKKELEKMAKQGQSVEQMVNKFSKQQQGEQQEQQGQNSSGDEQNKNSSPEDMAQQALDEISRLLADKFEPENPAARMKRENEIERAKKENEANGKAKNQNIDDGADSSQKNADSDDAKQSDTDQQKNEAQKRGADHSDDNVQNQNSGIKSGDAQEILDELNLLSKRRQELSLFLKYLPEKAKDLVRQLKKRLPRHEYEQLDDTHHDSGLAIDPKAVVADFSKPIPTGRVFQQRLAPGDFDAGMVALYDVSGSVSQGGGVDPSLSSSATSIYMGEELAIDYGEIIFGENYRWIKDLGRPVGNQKKKNEMLRVKRDAFVDRHYSQSTNIRDPLAEAIHELAKKPYKTKYLILVTDGEENSKNESNPNIPLALRGKDLRELRKIMLEHGIHPIVIAVGRAKNYVPNIFEDHEYCLTDNFSDVSELMMEIMADIHKRRLTEKYPTRRWKF